MTAWLWTIAIAGILAAACGRLYVIAKRLRHDLKRTRADYDCLDVIADRLRRQLGAAREKLKKAGQ